MHNPNTNVETQLYNERRLAQITADMENVYYSLFEWKNLPYDNPTVCEQVSRYIEFLFGTCPRVGAWMDENKGLLFGKAAGTGGLTWYNDYTKYSITNAIEETAYVDRDKAAVSRPNPLGTPILSTVEFYAGMVWQCERAIFVNLRGQNTPLIIEAPDGQELTYSNTYEQIAGYKPVVYGRKDFLGENSLNMHYFNPAPYIADNLMDLYCRWWGDFYNRCGLEAGNNNKRERLVAAEVNSNTDPVASRLSDLIQARTNLRDQINNLFGLNIDFEFMPGGIIEWRGDLHKGEITDLNEEGGECDELPNTK